MSTLVEDTDTRTFKKILFSLSYKVNMEVDSATVPSVRDPDILLTPSLICPSECLQELPSNFIIWGMSFWEPFDVMGLDWDSMMTMGEDFFVTSSVKGSDEKWTNSFTSQSIPKCRPLCVMGQNLNFLDSEDMREGILEGHKAGSAFYSDCSERLAGCGSLVQRAVRLPKERNGLAKWWSSPSRAIGSLGLDYLTPGHLAEDWVKTNPLCGPLSVCPTFFNGSYSDLVTTDFEANCWVNFSPEYWQVRYSFFQRFYLAGNSFNHGYEILNAPPAAKTHKPSTDVKKYLHIISGPEDHGTGGVRV